MIFHFNFNETDILKLFRTSKNHPENYIKIKDMLCGNEAWKAFNNFKRSRYFFIISLTAIALISSAYSLFAEHLPSAVAIWIIWTGFMVLISVSFYFGYKDQYLTLKKNQSFFDRFEPIALKSETEQDFIIDWNLKNDKSQ
jgi:hypothetical protein